MGKLAQQLSGKSQVKVFAKGGAVKSNPPPFKKSAKPEILTDKRCGGKVKK
jgi:hypothetical protein